MIKTCRSPSARKKTIKHSLLSLFETSKTFCQKYFGLFSLVLLQESLQRAFGMEKQKYFSFLAKPGGGKADGSSKRLKN